MTDSQNDKEKEERRLALGALYSEASEFDRHYDRMSWTIGTIITSVMIAILAFVGTSSQQTESSIFTDIMFLKSMAIMTVSIYSIFVWLIYKIGNLQKDRTRPIIKKMYRDSNIDPPKKSWEDLWDIHRTWISPFLILDILLASYWIWFIKWVIAANELP